MARQPSLRPLVEAVWTTHSPETPLPDWVAQQREQGNSWRAIARTLREETDGVADVTEQTLLNWYGDLVAERAS